MVCMVRVNNMSKKREIVTCPKCGLENLGPTESMINRVKSSGIFFARDRIEITCGNCGHRWIYGEMTLSEFFDFSKDSGFIIAYKIILTVLVLGFVLYLCNH